MNNPKVFLTAEWRKLALAQYAVDKEILSKYLPPHIELDDWQGKYYVSLVGFMFVDVKLRALTFLSIPILRKLTLGFMLNLRWHYLEARRSFYQRICTQTSHHLCSKYHL